MTNYIFIESRDPFESRDTFLQETAIALKQRGHEVTVFLIQNGVLAARRTVQGSYLERLARAGVTLLADQFSLSERGIQLGELASSIKCAGIEKLVEGIVKERTKAIWH